MEDIISTLEGVQYYGGGLVLWRISSVHVEVVQYCGGCSVLWRVFSTVMDVQYCGGYSVLWRMLSTVDNIQYCEGYHQFCGECSVNNTLLSKQHH